MQRIIEMWRISFSKFIEKSDMENAFDISWKYKKKGYHGAFQG